MNRNLVIGYKKISELERTLIENLTIYRNIIKQINSIQPNLSITSILKENICWIIGNLECIKQDDKLIDYRIGWGENTLKIICVNLKNKSIIIIIDLIRNKLFHENFTDNIHIYRIGVRK